MLGPDFIIFSRLKSTRLPFKAALNLPCGNSTIMATVLRCIKIKHILGINCKIFVACPFNEVNIYETLCKGIDVRILGGEENNVALRAKYICKSENIQSFIRVTGDNPYICVDVVEFLLNQKIGNNQCISLFHQKALPNGTVISHISLGYLNEICSIGSKNLNEHLILSEDKEINFLIKKPKIPKHLIWREGRFCIDTIEDFDYLYKNVHISKYFTVKEMKNNLLERKFIQSY